MNNVLRILETVAQLGTGVTAKEITDALQAPSTTVYRVLNNLVADEYLVRTSDLRGFALGHSISGLITAASPPVVPTMARRSLEEFRSETRYAVHLLMFCNGSLKIGHEDPDRPLNSLTDSLRYPHASAVGKLMLAQLEDISKVLPCRRLPRLTENTITDRQKLEDELVDIRSRKLACDTGELETNSATIALPVSLPGNCPRAAIFLVGPTSRFSVMSELIEPTRELSARLAPMLF